MAASGILRTVKGNLGFQFDVPVQPIAPRFVEEVGRKALSASLQLPVGRPDWLAQHIHMRLLGRAPALLHIAGRASREDVLPRCLPAEPARHYVIECQALRAAAILAGEPVAQEQVEAREGRELAGLHILPQRDDRRDRHIERRRVNCTVIAFDHIDPLKEHGLDRGLPWPKAERIIG